VDSQQSTLSLHGSATVEATDTDRNATIQSTSDRECASGRGHASLYAALEHDAITALAHRYWQERGCPEGSAAEDWFRAEQDFHKKMEFGYSPDYYEVVIALRLPH
jgi:hypothetical protein